MIEDEIKEFKNKNGNNTYGNKDFLIYIASKVEKIDEKLFEGASKIASNRIKSDIALWGLSVIIAAILAQLFGLI